jgi:hypothetical protein
LNAHLRYQGATPSLVTGFGKMRIQQCSLIKRLFKKTQTIPKESHASQRVTPVALMSSSLQLLSHLSSSDGFNEFSAYSGTQTIGPRVKEEHLARNRVNRGKPYPRLHVATRLSTGFHHSTAFDSMLFGYPFLSSEMVRLPSQWSCLRSISSEAPGAQTKANRARAVRFRIRCKDGPTLLVGEET